VIRRIVAALATAGLALLVVASTASGDESIGSGTWAGSYLDPQPGPNSTGELSVTGVFKRFLGSISLQFTVSASEGGCAVPNPAPAPAAASPRQVSVALTVPCNGLYTVRVDARSQYGETAYLDQTIVVQMPAPTVTGVSATADGRSIDVSWDDMRAVAPDLSGYVVERRIGDSPFEEVAAPAADEQVYTDDALPTEGGEASYRVRAIRPVPGGTVTSQSSDEAVTPFVAAPAGSGGSGGSSGSGTGTGADGGSTDGATGDPSTPGGASGGSPSSGGSGSGIRAPRVAFSGTFLPPLLRPTALNVRPTTTTTIDAGFDETLPYDAEGGADDPTPSDDEMASIFTDSDPGRGMVIPVATALVLALWAVHLRMLARAARPLD
jgi:hypothetical protein